MSQFSSYVCSLTIYSSQSFVGVKKKRPKQLGERIMRLGIITLILASVALSSGSQIVLKLGVTQRQIQDGILGGDKLAIVTAIATSPLVVAGLACYGLSAVLWLFVLSRTPLSTAYPFIALGIIVIVTAGHLTFGERLSFTKLSGVALITIGILTVAAGV